MSEQEIIRKLREIAALKVGDPFPESMGGNNNWGEALSALCGEAADLIEQQKALAYDV